MVCKGCKEEVDELHPIRVEGRTRRLCEECVERLHEEGAIADEALNAVRDMLGFKGRF